VLGEHGYARCGSNTVMLRKAGVDLRLAPSAHANEVWYAPAWAVLRLDELRQQATRSARRLYGTHVEQALRSNPRFGPPPEALLARLDELRAFAVLRGWRLTSGTWNTR
jgi:hypothetical protein